MLGLAVCGGQLDVIKYLVTECSAIVNGEQSVYVKVHLTSVLPSSIWNNLAIVQSILKVFIPLKCSLNSASDRSFRFKQSSPSQKLACPCTEP